MATGAVFMNDLLRTALACMEGLEQIGRTKPRGCYALGMTLQKNRIFVAALEAESALGSTRAAAWAFVSGHQPVISAYCPPERLAAFHHIYLQVGYRWRS